ncbi:MAG: DNA polymerase III subunit delta [Candidatus Yanofskybacteria bacterium]|nr:DNA polymerase III subunit delta [Candidatus Yanofskybacteria bacterium]
MILFYYGPDIHRVRQKTTDTIHRYREKYAPGFNLFVFDFNQENHEATFEQALKNTSFFPETKLLVIKHATHSASVPSQLLEVIKNNKVPESKDIVVLFHEEVEEEELQKHHKEFFSYLKREASQSVFYPLLENQNLVQWVKKACTDRDASIDPTAAKKLIQLTGNDTLLLEQEIIKLVNYTEGKPISEKDVEQLVSAKITLNIFDFIDALATRSRERAFVLLHQELEDGRDAHYLLAMITYQFRTLLNVKDLLDRGETMPSIIKKAGLAPFVARKAIQQAQKFDSTTLKFIYQTLLTLDTQAKDGKGELSFALSKLVLQV